MSRDVFISYSSKDKAIAHAICQGIESRGITCWIAPRDIMPSETWGAAIIRGIKEAKVMLVIFTSNANESRQIMREVERAVHFGRAVLPMRIENVPPSGDLEYFLAIPHWFDAFAEPLQGRMDPLVAILQQLLASGTPAPGHAPAVAPAAAPTPAPAPAAPTPIARGSSVASGTFA